MIKYLDLLEKIKNYNQDNRHQDDYEIFNKYRLVPDLVDGLPDSEQVLRIDVNCEVDEKKHDKMIQKWIKENGGSKKLAEEQMREYENKDENFFVEQFIRESGALGIQDPDPKRAIYTFFFEEGGKFWVFKGAKKNYTITTNGVI